jgi:predicted RNA binding protein YcfA (HicA-like mRNA interferase family)
LPKPALETSRRRIVARLEREGWIERHGGEHDIYTNAARPGRIIAVPRHRTVSIGVARKIAKEAGWL